MKVLIAAGGTGGHIIPALVFGDWVKRNINNSSVIYVSGSRPLELEIYRAHGVSPNVLDMEGSPLGAGKFARWLDLLSACRRTWNLLGAEKPDACVGFGGYISAPSLLLGSVKGLKLATHEQNAFAGKVTRLAAKIGIAVAAAWEVCSPLKEGDFKRTGMPVRAFRSLGRAEAARELGVAADVKDGYVVGVMGGSLGSAGLKELISEIAESDELAGAEFVVMGREETQTVKVRRNVTIVPRRWDISPLYNISDLMITRGGASTLAELDASGVAGIVVPWGRAADGHQAANAREIIKNRRTEIWLETEQKSELIRKINKMRSNRVTDTADISKRMYNISEKNCDDLWSLIAD